MDPNNSAKGKSRFDLTDVMSILDGGELAKIDDTIDEEPQESPETEYKAPEVKISIVTLPAVMEKEELEIIAKKEQLEIIQKAMAPAIKSPEKIIVTETNNAQAKADNALSAKLLADMEHKNAEILKLKSDFMALQYKLNDKEYQLKEKDMNVQNMSTKLSDTQNKFETHKKHSNDLHRKHDEVQRQLENLQREHDDVQRQNADLQRQLEGQQRQYSDLQKQLESQQRQHDDLQKQYDVIKAELDEINEDKAKVMARAQAHKLKKTDGFNATEEEQTAPEEDDVASIFKRLTQDKPEEQQANTQDPEKPQENVPGFDRPQPPRKLKTAKLYDL